MKLKNTQQINQQFDKNIELFSEIYDNELIIYKRIKTELRIMNSEIYSDFYFETLENFEFISSSIKKSIEKSYNKEIEAINQYLSRFL